MTHPTTPAADLDGLAVQRAKLDELLDVSTTCTLPRIQRVAAYTEAWQIIDGLLSAHRALLEKLGEEALARALWRWTVASSCHPQSEIDDYVDRTWQIEIPQARALRRELGVEG